MTREEILVKAAGHLRENAQSLHECHTIAGRWPDLDPADLKAHSDHDEMKELAAGLLAMSRPALKSITPPAAAPASTNGGIK